MPGAGGYSTNPEARQLRTADRAPYFVPDGIVIRFRTVSDGKRVLRFQDAA